MRPVVSPGQALLSAVAQASRLAGSMAADVGWHSFAQRHYIQTPNLAMSAGDRLLAGCRDHSGLRQVALVPGLASRVLGVRGGIAAAPYASEIGARPAAIGLLLAAHLAGLVAGSVAIRWLG